MADGRLRWIMVLFGGWALVLVARLIQVQVVDRGVWSERALRQYYTEVHVAIGRGVITDRWGHELAMNRTVYSLYLRPVEVVDLDRTLEVLRRHISFSVEAVREQALERPHFVWVARKRLDGAKAQAILASGLPGVYVVPEEERVYPQRHLAGALLGWVGIDNQGLSGVEFQYDAWLRGERRPVSVGRDGLQRYFWNDFGMPVAGRGSPRLELALDLSAQYMAEKILAEGVEQTGARRGLVLAMDPWTGEVLVHAQYPFFDPSRYVRYLDEPWTWNFCGGRWTYEPGSTLKPAIGLAALWENPSIRDQQFYGGMGQIQLMGVTIRDHRPFGWLRFDDVFVYSSNVGAIRVGLTVPPARLYERLRAFGFGQPTGVDAPGEQPGLLRPPERWSRVDPAYLSIGQGMEVTPLQIVRFYAMLANGGFEVTPRLARRFIDPAGQAHRLTRPLGPRRIPAELVRSMTEILEAVVERGTGRRAQVPGLRIAGKTGTAQKVGPSGTYEAGRYIASFVGFFPVETPRVVLLVMLDEPRGSFYGSEVAAPLFQAVARTLAARWRLEPPGEPAGPAPVQVHWPPGGSVGPDAWPDWVGRDLEEVLDWSRRVGVSITMIGQGRRVVRQLPPGGTSLEVRHGIVWVERVFERQHLFIETAEARRDDRARPLSVVYPPDPRSPGRP